MRSRSKFSKLVIWSRVCRIIAEFIAGHSWVFERMKAGSIRTRPSSLRTLTACSLNRKLLPVENPAIDFRRPPIFFSFSFFSLLSFLERRGAQRGAATVVLDGIDVLHKVFMGYPEEVASPRVLFTYVAFYENCFGKGPPPLCTSEM